MSTNPQERILQLRELIRHHDHLYYIEARPEIGDREYDALYHELLDLETAHPQLVTPDSPTRRMHGGVATGFVTVKHSVPMISLENTYNTADLERFHEGVLRGLHGEKPVYVIEPKIDGISIAVRYENGVLTQALTRGNGKEGDDVTANIRTIPSIPLRLNCPNPPAFFEARGECYMPKAGFQQLNEHRIAAGEEPFANARNATAGSVKLLDPAQVATRPLDVLFYTQGRIDGMPEITSQQQLFQTFRDFGLKVQSWSRTTSSFDGIVAAINELFELRRTLPYETDGAVIKVDSFQQRERLGYTAKAPCWAKAYKYEPERAATRLNAITIQVGRTGVLTPVAELTPVALAGSTISRATLHNEDEIARNDIRIGDTVIIEKAGEVIPAVVKVDLAKRPADALPFDFFQALNGVCPSCGQPIHRDPKFAAWRCENLQCPAQNVRRVEYFSARNALDIENVGGVVAEALCERGLIREPLDLFTLTQDQLAGLNLGTDDEPRVFGPKNAAKVLAALELARTKPLGAWLQAMGIPEVGAATAYQLGRLHKDINHVVSSPFLKALLDLMDYQNGRPVSRSFNQQTAAEPAPEATGQLELNFAPEPTVGTPTAVSDLIELLLKAQLIKPSAAASKGGEYVTTSVGPKTAQSVLDFFDSAAGKHWLRRLAELDINPVGEDNADATSNSASDDSPVAGKTFVLTGTLTAMDRDTASDHIRQLGGKVASSVSRNTTYLVAGANTGARKTEKAADLGVTVIDEATFLTMIGQ